jgi:hypothetical protein
VTLRGNVRDFPLRAVVELLAQTKKTGELQVRTGDSAGALGIADGRIVAAVFGEEEPLLAFGAIFALEGADFEFTPWDDAPPTNVEGTLDELVRKADKAKKQAEEARRKAEEEAEAARRKAEEEAEAARKKAEEEAEAERQRVAELRALIPRDDVPFRLSERAVDQGAVTLTSERWRVVLTVNGQRDVNAIASMLHLDHRAALTALAALVRDGVIEAVEPPAGAPEPAYQAPAFEAPAFESAAPSESALEASGEPFAQAPNAAQEFTPSEEAAPASENAAATQDWITPAQVSPGDDWTTASTEPPPISEVAPQWSPPSETPAPDWITPEAAEPRSAADDRLSALSGIFGPAPAEPEAAAPVEPPVNSWAPPTAAPDQWGARAPAAPATERWSAPPDARPTTPAESDDPWGTPPASAPRDSWTPPASAPAPPAKDTWTAPAPERSTWSAPAASTPAADAWGTPPAADPRAAALNLPGSGAPAEEWSAPPAAPTEKKKRGLFGFGREKAAPPVAGGQMPSAVVGGSRVTMLAALANALIAEYNSGQYGKGRIEERIANLLMRVDEQADPIDRPLPIVDDRIDVEALERERLAESQTLPYLALLVTTIYTDAEKAFGKDKAKKGYKAAQQSVPLGDASALFAPELAGKLPRV